MSILEYVYNKQDEVTAKQLCDHYRNDLPMLVMVSTGFYGNREEMTFSTGQVLRLHELRQQQRALVHDDKNSTLSLPMDYSLLFFVDKKQEEAFTLRQIIERYSLPIKVKFADPHVHFDLGDDCTRTGLTTLKIVTVHEEPYFVANTVSQGVLLKEVIPIPLYLSEVKFCPVTGLRGKGIMDNGKDRMDKILFHPQSTAHIDFSRDHSDRGVVQLSHKPIKATENIHQNIETNIYVNIRESSQRQFLPTLSVANSTVTATFETDVADAEESPPKRPPKPEGLKTRMSHHADGVYEVVSLAREAETNVYEIADQRRSLIKPKPTSPVAQSQKKPPVPSQLKPPTVASELASVLEKRKQRTEDSAALTQGREETTATAKPEKGLSKPKPQTNIPAGIEKKLNPARPPPPSASELPKQASSPPLEGKTDAAPFVGANPPQTTGSSTSETKPTVSTKPVNPTSHTGQFAKIQTLAGSTSSTAKAPNQKPQHAEAPPPQRSNDADMYINQREMAVIGPSRSTAKSSKQDNPPLEKQPSEPQNLQALDTNQAHLQKQSKSAQMNVGKMTMEDVQQLLTKLNLSRYRDQFQNDQVDGLLLQQLDADALKEDFKMTHTETLRLRNFVEKGHLPK